MTINWPHLRARLREDILALPHFFRNPVQGMRTLPDWEWPTILVLQGAMAISCSLIANLIERDFFGMVTSVVIGPIMNYLMAAITSGFFYYLFMLGFKRELPYRQIYIHVLFASIPLAAVSTIAFLLPPLILVGTAASLMLLFVGFVDNYQIPARPLRNILAAIFAIHVLYWGFLQINSTSKHKSMRQRATPESLDILEKELKDF